VEKYGTAGEAINKNMIWRMRIACRIPKATNTHREYVITYCFSTATMIRRTHLNITFNVSLFYPLLLQAKYGIIHQLSHDRQLANYLNALVANIFVNIHQLQSAL
jgi:iron-sulfur cluster repair protein YtfE (RIC family)